MPTETLYPDAILASAGPLTGAVTDIDDDPASADGLWLTAPGNNTPTSVRVSFPSPTGNPTAGAGLQTFRVQVRKTNHSTDPAAVVELYENGSLVSTVVASTTITSITGQVLSGTWNASTIGTPNGSLVELRVVGSPGGGTPSNRASVEVGAVAWDVDYTVTAPVFDGTGSSTATASQTGSAVIVDSVNLYARVYESDGTTPLTDRVLVASNANISTTYSDFNATFTLVGAPTKTQIDGARLVLEWEYTLRAASRRTRVTAVTVPGTYAASASTTYDGTGTSTTTASESGLGELSAGTTGIDSALASESSAGELSASTAGTDAALASESGSATIVGGSVTYDGTGTSVTTASQSGLAESSFATVGTDAALASESGVGIREASPVSSDSALASESGAATGDFGTTSTSTTTASESGVGIREASPVSSDSALASESAGALADLEATGSSFTTASESGVAVIVGASVTYDGTGTSISTASESGSAIITASPQSSDAALVTESAQGTAIISVSGSDASLASEGSAANAGLGATGASVSGASESAAGTLSATTLATDAADTSEVGDAVVDTGSVVIDATGTDAAATAQSALPPEVSFGSLAADASLASESGSAGLIAYSTATSFADSAEASAVSATFGSIGTDSALFSEFGIAILPTFALIPAPPSRTAIVYAISVSYALDTARSVQPRASPRVATSARVDRTATAPRRNE